MTAFLWRIVILMAAALLAEILAFVGMAMVAMRAARRAEEIKEQMKGRQQGRRGIYREVVEPVQTASQVVRGLKLALWLFRKVA